jgi:glucose/arabinose dehydrogenase
MLIAVLGLSVWCGACTQASAPDTGQVKLDTVLVAGGLTAPLYLTAPPGDARLFVVEQPGRIRVIVGGALQATPFLDLTDRVSYGGERGLLSVAFHPAYASNGYFYVAFTDSTGDVRVERYRVSTDPNLADKASVKQILVVGHRTYSNHNGGLVAFGPDGKLYVGLGDGGGGGDALGSGQNRGTLLGKLLRIDVDAGDPYAVPPDNPFVSATGARGEIWAYGLRNPWRFAFDREAGRLYIADVGQSSREEVDVVSATSGGLNYGWNVMEGDECYDAGSCNQAGLTLPVLAYGHSDGCSITGGYVYRGQSISALRGTYFYSDYCSGWLKSFRYDGAVQDQRDWGMGLGSVLSFGEDAAGELYVLTAAGKVYSLISR